MIEVLSGKIHRAIITDSNINYEGSITIDKKLLDAAGMLEYQKVSVVDIENGNRFETYIIVSDISGMICVNGAAARLVCVGDHIIIMAFQLLEEKKALVHHPMIVRVDEKNKII